MKIFGLYLRARVIDPWESPILYSTDVVKLRKVILAITNSNRVIVGSDDVTNCPETNSYLEINGLRLAKIAEMPTLI